MDFIELFKEFFRPKLKIRKDIVKREKKFNEQNPNRRNWMLETTYLSKGGLEQLKQEENYDAPINEKIVYYLNYKRYKKVTVRITGTKPTETRYKLLEEKLKEALFLRGCNAGVYYKKHMKNNDLVGEAVPAIISQE